ncbi:MAG: type II and III secretion system protein family protein [Hyphomonadaceae bacterium]
MLKTIRQLFLALIAAGLLSTVDAQAQNNLLEVNIDEPGGDTAITRQIILSLNKSTIVEVGRPASDVVITNPLIADAAVQTSQRMIFRGVSIGTTNAFIFDDAGNQMLNLEIRVEPDVSGLTELINRHVPDARVNVEAVNSNVVLTGLVDSLSASDAVIRLSRAFIGAETGDDADGPSVINMMQIAAKDQVLLQVRIVEMQRSVIKQLGINLNSGTNFGALQGERLADAVDPATGLLTGQQIAEGAPPFFGGLGLDSSTAFNVAGGALGGLGLTGTLTNLIGGQDERSSLTASLTALERVGVVRTLAEPNITALSGEPANFLAGGEFPVPVDQGDDGAITVEFRSFGIGLGFTPIVLSEGRISLRMSTEVSELSSAGAFQGASATGVGPNGEIIVTQGLTIPALTVNRAETTVELPSGQSMMIAGLIQSTTRQTIDAIPGVKNIPILGALFRSRDFLNEESELVIIVTPYLVDPAKQADLRTPDTGFANPSDAKTILFGKLNRLYGKDEIPADATQYSAPVGFIEE